MSPRTRDARWSNGGVDGARRRLSQGDLGRGGTHEVEAARKCTRLPNQGRVRRTHKWLGVPGWLGRAQDVDWHPGSGLAARCGSAVLELSGDMVAPCAGPLQANGPRGSLTSPIWGLRPRGSGCQPPTMCVGLFGRTSTYEREFGSASSAPALPSWKCVNRLRHNRRCCIRCSCGSLQRGAYMLGGSVWVRKVSPHSPQGRRFVHDAALSWPPQRGATAHRPA